MKADFRAGGVGYGEFKKRLFERIWEYFEPMRRRRAEIDAGYLAEVLKAGGIRAREVACARLGAVREAVGLSRLVGA